MLLQLNLLTSAVEEPRDGERAGETTTKKNEEKFSSEEGTP